MHDDGRSAWSVADECAAAADRWALGNDNGFASREWAHVVEGIGCKVALAWHAELGVGVVAPVFTRGPLRIAFLGFPVAGAAFDGLPLSVLADEQRLLGETLGCSLVRTACCGVREPAEYGTLQPETWIEDLAAWPKRGSKARRIEKDLAFALRSTEDLEVFEGLSDADAAHALYRTTVLKHGGRVRYTLEYFRRLQSLCASGLSFRAISFCDRQGRTVGFGVAARHGVTGYYLHGAVGAEGRSKGVGDLILSGLIERAREDGASRFSLMASPPDQAGLIQYKRKWGDCEGYTRTLDVGRGIVGASIAWFLRKRSRPRPLLLRTEGRV